MVSLVAMALAALSARNRVPWDDEGEFSDAAWNLAAHGFMGTTVLDYPGDHLSHIGQRTYWVMPAYLLGQAAWYLVFPGTVFWARAFTIIWIPVALWAFARFLERFTGNREATALAVVFFGLSYSFVDNAGFARPDLMCCALGLSGPAAYVSFRERSLGLALLLGNGFVAASFLTHPNGVFHFLGLAAVVLWLDGRRLSAKLVLLSAVPYLAALGAWSLYIAGDPQAFAGQMLANGANNGRWTSTWNPILILKNEIVGRYFMAFGLMAGGSALAKAYALAAYLAAIVGVAATPALRQRRPVRGVLLLLAVYFVAMSVFNQKLNYYLPHILPWYAALLALWVQWLWTMHRRLRPLVGVAAALVVLVDCSGIVLRARQRSYLAAQQEAVGFLRTHTSPSDRIGGTAGLVYALHFDARLREDKYLGLQGGPPPDAVVVDPDMWGPKYREWEHDKPEVLRKVRHILDGYRLAFDRGGYKIYLRK
jgi:hypothetical protein